MESSLTTCAGKTCHAHRNAFVTESPTTWYARHHAIVTETETTALVHASVNLLPAQVVNLSVNNSVHLERKVVNQNSLAGVI
ncbi:hypothetical protein TNCT_624411 [Trichonephila clavata]|uniref:Uncharacterized protein n=1 Tax=Trichonephila clavata TaxID=2740835 RepID=A0A8X6JCC4_TRICU|nr:hypothetical protein TNCT_624411 [Trichonephila clavata]